MSEKKDRYNYNSRRLREEEEDDLIPELKPVRPIPFTLRPNQQLKYGAINTGVANVYSSPNSSFSDNVVRRLYKTTRVVILSEDNGWTKIRSLTEPICEGYVVSIYLDLE